MNTYKVRVEWSGYDEIEILAMDRADAVDGVETMIRNGESGSAWDWCDITHVERVEEPGPSDKCTTYKRDPNATKPCRIRSLESCSSVRRHGGSNV